MYHRAFHRRALQILFLAFIFPFVFAVPSHRSSTTANRQIDIPRFGSPAATRAATPPSPSASPAGGQQVPRVSPGPAVPGAAAPPSPGTTPKTSPAPGTLPSPQPGNQTGGTAPLPGGGDPERTIWSLISAGTGSFDQNRNDYDMLAAAVTLVNYNQTLTQNLDGKGIALFAPSDAAFIRTAQDLGYPGNDEAGAFNAIVQVLTKLGKGDAKPPLYDIIGYHIIPGSITSQQMFNRGQVDTYNNIAVVVQGFKLLDVAAKLPSPQLIGGRVDIQASNGLIHEIDRVLFPFEVDPEQTRAIAAAAKPGGGTGTGTGTGTGNNTNPDGNQSGQAPICFPARVHVMKANGNSVRMDELNAGDDVCTDERGETSKIFLFSHRIRAGRSRFVEIVSNRGQVVVLSPSHLLYLNGVRAPARKARVGDLLRTINGEATVAVVREVFAEGLYAPHTMQGDIVVEGVVASTYTEFIPPNVAHALLAPVRALASLGVKEPLGNLLYGRRPHIGSSAVADAPSFNPGERIRCALENMRTA